MSHRRRRSVCLSRCYGAPRRKEGLQPRCQWDFSWNMRKLSIALCPINIESEESEELLARARSGLMSHRRRRSVSHWRYGASCGIKALKPILQRYFNRNMHKISITQSRFNTRSEERTTRTRARQYWHRRWRSVCHRRYGVSNGIEALQPYCSLDGNDISIEFCAKSRSHQVVSTPKEE